MVFKKSKTKQIGQILFEKGLLTNEQLVRALEVQSHEGGLLGNILVKLGYVSQEDIDESIDTQSSQIRRIDEILVEMGMISADQLAAAMEIHVKENIFLSQAIIKLGFISEEDFVSTLVTQYGFPFLQLDNYEIDPEVVKMITKDVAKKYFVIPIDKIGNILTVAMADPLNTTALNEIRQLTNFNVETFVSTYTDISNIINRHYA